MEQGANTGAWFRSARLGWWIFALLALALLAWPMATSPIFVGDTDLWYHLNAGRYIRDTGALPDRSFFSFIEPARAFTDYYWLSQVCFHWVYDRAGYAGLAALRVLLFVAFAALAAGFFGRGAETRGRAGTLLAGVLLILVLLVVQGRFGNLRPHGFTYLFALAFLAILELRPAWVPVLPVLAVAWVNLHGITYPLLLVICLAYLAELFFRAWRAGGLERAERLGAAALGLSMLAVWATPNLGSLLPVPFRLTPLAHEYIGELRKLSLAELADLTFEKFLPQGPTTMVLLLVAAILTTVLTLRKRDARIAHLLLFAGGTVLLAKGVRFASEFAIFTVPLVSGLPALLHRREERQGSWLHIPAMALALVPLAWAAWSARPLPFPFPSASLPTGTMHFLRTAGEGGKVFHHPNGGGFLQWELHPRYRIFMDMEIPFLFQDEDIAVALAAHGSPVVLDRILTRYAPEYVLAPHWEPAFGALMTARPEYAVVFMDDAAVLFAHRGRAAGVVARHERLALSPFKDPRRGFAGVVRPGNREAAFQELQALVALWPGAGLARQWMAQARLADGAPAEALAILDGIPRQAWTGSAAYLRGQALAALGRPAEAARVFEGGLDCSGGPEPETFHRAIARALHSVGDHRGAYAAFRRAVKVMDEPSAEDLFRYAVSAIGTGHVEEGIQLLRIAELRLRPDEEALRARVLSALATAGSAPIQGGPPVQSTEKSPYLTTQ